MTAFCRVSKVNSEGPPQPQPPPQPRPPAPPPPQPRPPAKKARPKDPARRPPSQARAKPRQEQQQGPPEPFEDTGFDFSDIPEVEPEWEEVHENLGDHISNGYPSDEELPPDVGSGSEIDDTSYRRRCPSPRSPVTFRGPQLDLEEEVF